MGSAKMGPTRGVRHSPAMKTAVEGERTTGPLDRCISPLVRSAVETLPPRSPSHPKERGHLFFPTGGGGGAAASPAPPLRRRAPPHGRHRTSTRCRSHTPCGTHFETPRQDHHHHPHPHSHEEAGWKMPVDGPSLASTPLPPSRMALFPPSHGDAENSSDSDFPHASRKTRSGRMGHGGIPFLLSHGRVRRGSWGSFPQTTRTNAEDL